MGLPRAHTGTVLVEGGWWRVCTALIMIINGRRGISVQTAQKRIQAVLFKVGE